nr:oligosaccharide flippase family protein [uncultured Blautia sp.]
MRKDYSIDSMSKNSRSKYLLKNTVIFAIGNFSTKLIAFFLVPFYTYVLTTEEYGVINLIFTLATLIGPFLMVNLQDAVRRFALESNADYKAILSVEWTVVIAGHLFGLVLIPLAKVYAPISSYSLELYFYIVSLSANTIFLEYLRGIERMKAYSFCSVFSSFAIAVLNILFLTRMQLGVSGYFLSYIIAFTFSSLIAIIIGKQYIVFREWKWDKTLFCNMLKFSIPMVPNSLLWWISSSSDHIMVTQFISAAANGIYTVSYKIPTLISTISNIFMQAWQISAIKENDNKKDNDFSNLMFDVYIRFITLLTGFLLIIIKPFMYIYVNPDFVEAWKYTPFLIIGYAFSTLGTFVGTPYYVYKDMKGNMFSAASGAIINVILNAILIPTIGVQGAAVATCVSYIVVFVYRVFDTRKYEILNYKKKEYGVFLFGTLILAGLCYLNFQWKFLIMLIIYICLIALNKQLIGTMIHVLKQKIIKK